MAPTRTKTPKRMPQAYVALSPEEYHRFTVACKAANQSIAEVLADFARRFTQQQFKKLAELSETKE